MKIGGNWTDDNRYIIYTGSDPRTKLDLWTLSVADRKPIPFLQTPFNEMHGQVSPDGRWIAYASDESGTWEVYVQTFPDAGREADDFSWRWRRASVAPRRARAVLPGA